MVAEDDDMPQMVCPKCGREEPDYDGFGMLAHTQPAYEHGCGYCTHPSIDGDTCGICGEVVPIPATREERRDG